MNPDLSQTLVQILGSAAAFAAIKFYDARRERRVRAKVVAKADESRAAAQEAAQQARIAASGSQQSTNKTQQTGEAVVLLAEQLGASLDNGRRLLASMDRMAEQNDAWFGAYTGLVALARTQGVRLRKLEEWAAESETGQHRRVEAGAHTTGDPNGND